MPSNNFCIIYVVRHAETEANKARVIAGQLSDPISENGITQAIERAKTLRSIKFEAAFSSDMQRAQQTAEIIARPHQLDVKTTQLLRERYYGSLQGLKYNEASEQVKALLRKYNEMSYEERLKVKLVDGMESDEELINRFTLFLRETAIVYSGRTVLTVSHGNIMRTFLVHLGFATHEELPPGAIEYTGYIKLETDGIDFFIKETNGIRKIIK